MINNTQLQFRIHELEILSGIKAHTIRIWESRYKLFDPDRLNRNIRIYKLSDLQKLLNIKVLYQNNFKISQIAKLSEQELLEEVRSISLNESTDNHYANKLLMSMYAFDDKMFEEVYRQQIQISSFEEIFKNTYIPLLNRIGLLWQTKGITAAHEHFISNLIFQKIALNITLQAENSALDSPVFVLYLPKGEIHEIALYFLKYYLKKKGFKSIYLGRDIPVSDLHKLNGQYDNIIWISAFMINIDEDDKDQYIQAMEELLHNTKNKAWVIGRIWDNYKKRQELKNIKFFDSFEKIDLNASN